MMCITVCYFTTVSFPIPGFLFTLNTETYELTIHWYFSPRAENLVGFGLAIISKTFL
jgi:hypothetical protein